MEKRIACTGCNKEFGDNANIFIKEGLLWHFQCWYECQRKTYNENLSALWEEYPNISKELADELLDNPGVLEEFEEEKYFALIKGDNGYYTESSNDQKDFFNLLEGNILFEGTSVEEIYIDKKPVKFDYKVVFELEG